jgi:hypothetical protein
MDNLDAAKVKYCPLDGTLLEDVLCCDDIIRSSCTKCGRIYRRASYIDDPLKVNEWRWF